MTDSLKVLALEPYYNISHAVFLDGFTRFSRHSVETWSLPGRKWKWRMRGAAYHFADLARRDDSGEVPDVIFASDFLNLSDWKAICPEEYKNVPTVLYFHENQASYPLSKYAKGDHDYGWINLSSSLAADRVLFNSGYHKSQFTGAIRKALALMADGVPPDLADRVEEKAEVFPVGIDFTVHDEVRDARPWGDSSPVILWNHRWEYDKRPEVFVDALARLVELGLDFRVVICGESFDGSCPAFENIEDVLGDRLLHLGFFDNKKDYCSAVAGADIVVSTTAHEFFGISIVEALYLGCIPVLPYDLSYPEILPEKHHSRCLYRDFDQLIAMLSAFLEDRPAGLAEEMRSVAKEYHWQRLAPKLDTILAGLA